MRLSQKGQDKSLLSSPAGREPSVLPAHPALERTGKCLRVHSGHLPRLKPSRRECSSFRTFVSKFPSSFTPEKPSPVTSYLGLTRVVSLLYPSLFVALKKSSCLGGISLRTRLTCQDRAQRTRGKAWFLQLQLEQKVSLNLSWYFAPGGCPSAPPGAKYRKLDFGSPALGESGGIISLCLLQRCTVPTEVRKGSAQPPSYVQDCGGRGSHDQIRNRGL